MEKTNTYTLNPSLSRYLLVVNRKKAYTEPICVVFDGTNISILSNYLQQAWPTHFVNAVVAQDAIMHLAWGDILTPEDNADLSMYRVKTGITGILSENGWTEYPVDTQVRIISVDCPYILIAQEGDDDLICSGFLTRKEVDAALTHYLNYPREEKRIAFLIYSMRERKGLDNGCTRVFEATLSDPDPSKKDDG